VSIGGRHEVTIFELTAEVLIFLLRVLLLTVLYLFLVLVVLAIRNDVRQTAAPPPAQAARLVVLSAGQTDLEPGETLGLADVTSVGRSERNRVVLRDSFVSAEHAVIRFADDGWWLEDCGSTNGTLLNDRIVEAPASLGNGDVVSIGQIRLRMTV
jgi:FHA domain